MRDNLDSDWQCVYLDRKVPDDLVDILERAMQNWDGDVNILVSAKLGEMALFDLQSLSGALPVSLFGFLVESLRNCHICAPVLVVKVIS